MPDTSVTDLVDLGLAAGREFAGAAVQEVAVEPNVGWTGRSLYDFWYLIDPSDQPPGSEDLMAKLSLRLSGELLARGDDSLPLIHFLDSTEWARRRGA